MPHSPSAQVRLRIKTTTARAVAKRMAEGHEPNLSAYIRRLIEADLRVQPDQDRLGLLEETVAANHRQVVEIARSLATSQRATYALLEKGLLALLAYVPEVAGGPAADAKAEALGRSRFQVVLKAAKQSSFALLAELAAELERQTQGDGARRT